MFLPVFARAKNVGDLALNVKVVCSWRLHCAVELPFAKTRTASQGPNAKELVFMNKKRRDKSSMV